MKQDPYLTPYTKTTSKWIKDLNIKPITIKFIEEKIGPTLQALIHGINRIQTTTINAQTPTDKLDNWDLLKIKHLCSSKDFTKRVKREPTDWEKILDGTSQTKV